MHSEMPGRVVEPSAQMGQLLLRGFAMLAAVCDDCQYPLMRDPQTLVSHCVGCRRLFDEDGNPQDHPAAAAAAPAPAAAAAPATANGPVVNGPLSPSQPASNGHHVAIGQQQQQQPANQAAAAAASNGPVVLTYTAHIQQQQQQQQDEIDSEEERETAQIRQRLEQHRLRQQQQQQRGAAAAANGDNVITDPSQLLADKLLAGWAMLAQSCPICHTPLMRSRAGEVRCIACDMTVVIERQQRQQRPPPAAAAAGSTAPAAAQAEPTAGSGAETTPAAAAHVLAAPASPMRMVASANRASALQQRSAVVGLHQPNMFHSNQARPDVQPQPTPAQQQQQWGIPATGTAGAGQDSSSAHRAAAAAGGGVCPATDTNAASLTPNTTTSAGGGVGCDEEGVDSGSNLVLHEQEVLQGLLQAVLMKMTDSRQQLMLIPASQTEAIVQQLFVVQKLVETLEVVKQAMLR